MNDLINAINNLEKELYRNSDSDKLDIKDIEKPLYELLKNCLLSKQYEVQLGSYTINVNPKDLKVIYDTETTYIELSNDGNFEETITLLPVRYYCIKPNQDIIPGDEPSIKLSPEIYIENNHIHHNYIIETNTNNNITNFVNDYYTYDEENNVASISKEININDEPYDVEEYLTMEVLKRVKYNPIDHTYTIIDSFNDNINYKEIIPNITSKKRVVALLYKYLIDFYKSYLQNNSVRTN